MKIESKYLPTVTGRQGLTNVPLQFRVSNLPTQRLRLKKTVKAKRASMTANLSKFGLKLPEGYR